MWFHKMTIDDGMNIAMADQLINGSGADCRKTD